MPRIARSTVNNPPAIRADMIRVFLSYKLEDEDRAGQLETALRAAGGDRIDVFRARQIPPGANWKRLIRQEIANSHILLLLYTDDSRDWAWCLFECGMFLRNAQDGDIPLICLHHSDARAPDPLSDLESMSATKENARNLLKFILHDYPKKRNMRPINADLFEDDQYHRQILEVFCGQIVSATGEKAEKYYVHDAWLKASVCKDDIIVIGDGNSQKIYDLRNNVRVQLSFSLAMILGLQHTSVTWDQIRSSLVNDYRWIGALANDVNEFIGKKKLSEDRSILEMFRSDCTNRLYRPYLHQVDRGADGRYCFCVHFMEESSLDYQSLSPQLGMLFTGMTLGVRFRHELLKQYRGQLDNWVLRRRNCRDVIKEIWHTIEQIEEEANARGTNDPQLFSGAFGQYGGQVGNIFQQWEHTRAQLVEICSACEACDKKKARCERLNNMDQILETLWDMNGRFLSLTSAQIHEVISRDV